MTNHKAEDKFIINKANKVVKYLETSCLISWCLKNLKPLSPTQSEKIMHKKERNAIESI